MGSNETIYRAPTPAECERVVMGSTSSSVTAIRGRAMMALMWRMGLTAGEVVGLRLGDIGAPNGQLWVGEFSEPHSRRVPIHSNVTSLLVTWLTEMFRQSFLRGLSTTTPLFTTLEKGRFDKPLNPIYVRAMIARAAKKASVESEFGAQSFRDSLALELRSAGYDIRLIQGYLGDRTQTRAVRYGDVETGLYKPDQLRDASWKHPDQVWFAEFLKREVIPGGPGGSGGYGLWERLVAGYPDGRLEAGPVDYRPVQNLNGQEICTLDQVLGGLYAPR